MLRSQEFNRNNPGRAQISTARRIQQDVAVGLRTQLPRIISPGRAKRVFSEFRMLNDSDTLSLLANNGLGLVRFGNSELAFIAGRDIRHQRQNRKLRNLLVEAIRSYNRQPDPIQARYLLALPLDQAIGFDAFNRAAKSHAQKPYRQDIWHRSPRFMCQQLANPDVLYGSTNAFRFSEAVVDTSLSDHITAFKKLLMARKSLYIGPTSDHHRAVEFCDPESLLSIPPSNAFEMFDDLVSASLEFRQQYANGQVLVTAGLTGTALSFRLNSLGIPALDIGQCLRHAQSLQAQG